MVIFTSLSIVYSIKMINILTYFLSKPRLCPNSVHQLTNTDFSSIVDCYYHAAKKKKQLRDAVEQANLRLVQQHLAVNDEFVDKLKTEIRLKVLSQRN